MKEPNVFSIYKVYLKNTYKNFLERKHAPNDWVHVVTLCCERIFLTTWLLFPLFPIFLDNEIILLITRKMPIIKKLYSSDSGELHSMTYVNNLFTFKVNLAGVVCYIYPR